MRNNYPYPDTCSICHSRIGPPLPRENLSWILTLKAKNLHDATAGPDCLTNEAVTIHQDQEGEEEVCNAKEDDILSGINPPWKVSPALVKRFTRAAVNSG